MMRAIRISELRKHLDHAKIRLASERRTLLQLHPIGGFNPEEYAFAYIRAERLGMRAINRRLAELDWLPMHLDTRSEILGNNRDAMKRWVKSGSGPQPDSDIFGNDFIHTLTRGSLESSWESPAMVRLTLRVANLFRDLSCLIGLLYYCSWFEENKVDAINITDPENLNLTAEEITTLLQSSQIHEILVAYEQDDKPPKRAGRGKAKKKEPVAHRYSRPNLRVIHNDHHESRVD